MNRSECGQLYHRTRRITSTGQRIGNMRESSTHCPLSANTVSLTVVGESEDGSVQCTMTRRAVNSARNPDLRGESYVCIQSFNHLTQLKQRTADITVIASLLYQITEETTNWQIDKTTPTTNGNEQRR